jgi:hypothetical protein
MSDTEHPASDFKVAGNAFHYIDSLEPKDACNFRKTDISGMRIST